MQTDLTDSFLSTVKEIMLRYEYYEKYLNYPGDYGERAFRGWLVFDLFHKKLEWPIKISSVLTVVLIVTPPTSLPNSVAIVLFVE